MEDLDFLHKNFDSSEDSANITPSIVIVEDDESLGLGVKKYLEKFFKLDIYLFTSVESCLLSINDFGQTPFLLIADISLGPNADGLLLIDALKEKNKNFASIVMTGLASVETAITATKKGVYHYLTKPFELDKLSQISFEVLTDKLGFSADNIKKSSGFAVIEKRKKEFSFNKILLNELKIETPKEDDIFCGMIGRSSEMKAVFAKIKRVAKSNATVSITGPSGTGKELVASAIHALSSRGKEKCIVVNCGAIPAELLESELFGHVKGAFTGAVANRLGRFELANNGTIFLDEIGDMPLLLQVKLLRVIQNKIVESVGSTVGTKVDIRIITATHKNLEQAVAEGNFREDLYYRLNVIPIKIPPLKDRREDIPLLIASFLDKFNRTNNEGDNYIDFSDEAIELILTYDWPGNVRELENLIERLTILKGEGVITPEDLPAKIYRNNPSNSSSYVSFFDLPKDGLDLKHTLAEIEDSLIIQALERTGGNKNQASKLLSLNRTTLIEKLKKKGLIHSTPN